MKRYILLLALVSMQANVILPNWWENFRSNLKSNFQSKMNLAFGLFKFKTAHAQESVVDEFKEKKDRLRSLTKSNPYISPDEGDKEVIIPSGEAKLNFDQNEVEAVAPQKESEEMKVLKLKEAAIRESFEEHCDNYLIRDDLNDEQRKQALYAKGICSGFLLKLLHELPESNTRERIFQEGGECIANIAQKQGEYKYKQSVDHSQLEGLTSEYWQTYKKAKQEFGQKVRDEALHRYYSGYSLSFLFKKPFGEKVVGKAIAKNNSYLSMLLWQSGLLPMSKSERQCRAEIRFGQ